MRYFFPISAKELSQRINEQIRENNELARKKDAKAPITFEFKYLSEQITSDLRVEFEDDNEIFESKTLKNYNYKNIVGLHTLKNGLTFQGILSGSDFQPAVFYIIYFDGRKLRAYVPTEGNLWNTDTLQAYGYDIKEDQINILKRFNKDFSLYHSFPKEFYTSHDVEKIVSDIEKNVIIYTEKDSTYNPARCLNTLKENTIQLADDLVKQWSLESAKKLRDSLANYLYKTRLVSNGIDLDDDD